MEKLSKQLSFYNIHAERFIGVDGRCSNCDIQVCKDKAKTFEMFYDVNLDWKSISIPESKLKELIPASALTISTLIMLRQQVKNKWAIVLICEDDIEME